MDRHAYIFIGNSGSGKGTQIALLEKQIRTFHPDTSLLHIETGALFRSFITTDSYTARETRALLEEGKLPPPFIGVHVWSHELIARYNGQQYVLIDGAPRMVAEVPVLLSAAAFYGWQLHVVYLQVSDAWADEHLAGRGREDDVDSAERRERIKWFHANVLPAIDVLRAAPGVTFHTINGERPIADIHVDICKNVGL